MSVGKAEIGADMLVGNYFKNIIRVIVNSSKSKTINNDINDFDNVNGVIETKDVIFDWLPTSCAKAAFEVLVRICPQRAWHYHEIILGE